MLVMKPENENEESRGAEGARRATGVAREAAGRILFFMSSSGYQPPAAKVATHPPLGVLVQIGLSER